jgi:hypothetical protein
MAWMIAEPRTQMATRLSGVKLYWACSPLRVSPYNVCMLCMVFAVEGSERRKAFAVLNAPPIASIADAVRATIERDRSST